MYCKGITPVHPVGLKRIAKASGMMLMMVLWLGLAVLPVNAAQVPASSMQNSDAGPLLSQLFAVSGLQDERDLLAQAELPTEVFTNPLMLLFIGMPESQVQIVNQLYADTYDTQEYYDAIANRFANHFDEQKAQEVIKFFSSMEGAQARELELEFAKNVLEVLDGGQKLLTSYRESRTQGELPSGRRLAVVAQLAKAQKLVKREFRLIRSVLREVAPLNSYFRNMEPGKHVNRTIENEMSEKLDDSLPDYKRTVMIAILSGVYNRMSTPDLEKVVAFYQSPAGKWYQSNRLEGEMEAQALMNTKARMRLENVIASLDENREDKEIFKEIFPPGLRHLFNRNRDPFDPLVKVDEPGEEDTDTAITGDRMGEAEGLPSIPYEFYLTLKEIDPELYDKLEVHGNLFREKTELDQMTEEEFQQTKENYRGYLENALAYLEEEVATDLQVDLSGLSLVGTIDLGSERIALVEASGSKGYTVRKGTLMGPNFGVVETVGEDGIKIVEQTRKFDGEIVSQEEMLEYFTTQGN